MADHIVGPVFVDHDPVDTAVRILMARDLWILLLVIASVIVITRYAITREELYLEQLFGQEYLKYKQRVRRWF